MPKPLLQAMVLADHVYQDRLTGKFIIAGTFSQIIFGSASINPQDAQSGDAGERRWVNRPITQVGSPYLYLALVEVHGEIPLAVKFVDLSNASVLFEVQLIVNFADPLAVAEYAVPMPPLPANKAGNYSLDLLHDGEILGSWRIFVRKLENPPAV